MRRSIRWCGAVVLILMGMPGAATAVRAESRVPAADATSRAGTAQPDVTTQNGARSGAMTTKDPYTVVVTDEMRAHQRWVDVLYFVGSAWGMLVLLAVLAFGISRRLRDRALAAGPQPFLAAMVFFALFTVVTTLLTLPFDVVADYLVPHHYGLSEQGLGGWLWDQGKGLIMGILLGAPVTALVLLAIRRFRRWWLVLWLGTVPLATFLIFVSPVLLDPVFNDFKPLQDQQLKGELLDLAERAGISGGRIFQVDKSKQTKTMNAYVNGIGPTKRIVMWDTIIAKMDRDELKFVMAHEMGHYVLHHVWKLLGLVLALMLGVFWLGQRAVEAATARWGQGWGFEHPHDPAALPLLALVMSLLMFALTPVLNGISRHFEAQSDTFALELTHLNDAGARAFVKFAEDSKMLPDPHPFIRFWRYSHPTLAERIVFCRSYKPWESGQPNRLWHASRPEY